MPALTLRQRFGLLSRALVGLFSDHSVQAAWGMLAGLYPGMSGAPAVRGTKERLEAYGNLPWLHAVADRVASAFAAVEWKLYVTRRSGQVQRAKAIQRAGAPLRQKMLMAAKQEGELQEVTEHIFLDVLHNANEFQTGVDFRRISVMHWDIGGEVFWLKERNGLGAPAALWPIPPSWVLKTPTPTDRVYRVGFRGWQGVIPETEFVWIPKPNPANPYGRGVGMVQALADELESDEYAAKHMRQFFQNHARPDFLVWPKSPTRLNESEARRLEEDWLSKHGGFWRAFKPRFLSGEVGVYEFTQNFRQLQLVQLREFSRDLIRQVWGVPPVILGIIEPGQSRATVGVEQFVFAKWVLVPRLEAFRATMQERLIPEYDPNLILDYESPVTEDDAAQLAAGQIAPWALTVDEWRDRQGLAALPDGEGEVFMVPLNLIPTHSFGGTPAPEPGSAPKPAAGFDGGLEKLSTDELLELRTLLQKAGR